MYQMTFAIITAAIAAGSFAERMKFSSMLIFFFIWHCWVYCPVANWHWGGGFLAQWGILDFAGGSVVHIVGGVTGVVGSVILGQRKPNVDERTDLAHVLTFIGGSLLWIGWFGFNAGSALSAGTQAGMAALITHLAASSCAFTWMVIEWLHKGKPTIVGVVSGAITGLVVITPAAGYVDHTGGFVMGLVGAPLCYGLVFIKNKLKLDEKPNQCDYPDAFGVHAIGGIVGALLLGFFAKPEIGGPTVAGVWYKLPGDQYTNGRQLGWQLCGVVITVGFTALVTALIMLILKFTIGINEPEETDQNAKEFQVASPVPSGQAIPMTMAPVQMYNPYGNQMPMGGMPAYNMGAPQYNMGAPPGMMAGFA